MQQQVSAPTLPTGGDYEEAAHLLLDAFTVIERIDLRLRAFLGDQIQENEPPREVGFDDLGRLFAFVDDIASTHVGVTQVVARLRERLVQLRIELAAFEQDHALGR
jgi:hypothetical protein